MSNARAGKRPHRNANAPADRTSLELLTLQHLRTVFGSARTHDAEVRRGAGISVSQLWALAEIAESQCRDGITVNGLSARLALHQTTASNLVNALAERGLIRRERDTADQRIVHLHVTTDGRKLLVRTPGPHAGLLVDALRNLRPAQLEQLAQSLESVVRQMRRTAGSAAGETLMGE